MGSRNKGEWRGSSVGSGERVKGEQDSLEAARVAETRVSGGWQENGEKRQGCAEGQQRGEQRRG